KASGRNGLPDGASRPVKSRHERPRMAAGSLRTSRMVEDRKKPVWPWIVAVLIGLPALYMASFGPACWWISPQPPTGAPRTPIDSLPPPPSFFRPAGCTATPGPPPPPRPLGWYAPRQPPIVKAPADGTGTTLVVFCADPAGLPSPREPDDPAVY